VGVVEIADAMARAQAAGLDLVEVAPMSRPPVCRIMDYGKWKYAQNKKEQKSKSHRHETELKEIRIKTPKIGDHDLGIKLNHAKEFLLRGDRVQFILRFRGRELAHIDEGEKIFTHIKQSLAEVAKVDQDFRREGKRISMTLISSGAKAKESGGAKPPKPKAPKPAGEPVAAKPSSGAAAEPSQSAPPASPAAVTDPAGNS
jgi:translation initiation factor IF-3